MSIYQNLPTKTEEGVPIVWVRPGSPRRGGGSGGPIEIVDPQTGATLQETHMTSVTRPITPGASGYRGDPKAYVVKHIPARPAIEAQIRKKEEHQYEKARAQKLGGEAAPTPTPTPRKKEILVREVGKKEWKPRKELARAGYRYVGETAPTTRQEEIQQTTYYLESEKGRVPVSKGYYELYQKRQPEIKRLQEKETTMQQATPSGKIEKEKLSAVAKARKKIRELEYKLEMGKIKSPAKKVALGVGIAGLGYVKGFAKGATALVRPKFYTKEIPEMAKTIVKPSRLYPLGEEIKRKPWLLAEIAGYRKGAKIGAKIITKPLLKAKLKTPKDTSVSDYKPPKVKGRKPSIPIDQPLTKEQKAMATGMRKGYATGYRKIPVRELASKVIGKVKKKLPKAKKEDKPKVATTGRKDFSEGDFAGKKFGQVQEHYSGQRQQYVLVEEQAQVPSAKVELIFPSMAKLKTIAAVRLASPALVTTQLTTPKTAQVAIPTTKTAQVTTPKTLATQTSKTTMQSQINIQKQVNRQIQSNIQKQSQSQIQRQSQIQKQVTSQIQKQSQLTKQTQAQLQKQTQIQKEILKTTRVPTTFPPLDILKTKLKKSPKIKPIITKPPVTTYTPTIVGVEFMRRITARKGMATQFYGGLLPRPLAIPKPSRKKTKRKTKRRK